MRETRCNDAAADRGTTIATFTPVRRPGSRPMVARGPVNAAINKIVQIAGKYANGFFFRFVAQVGQQFGLEDARTSNFTFQVQRTTSCSQLSAARPLSSILYARQSWFRGFDAAFLFVVQRQRNLQDAPRHATAEKWLTRCEGHPSGSLWAK